MSTNFILTQSTLERLECIAKKEGLEKEIEKSIEFHLESLIYSAYIRLPLQFQTASKGKEFPEADIEYENSLCDKFNEGR